MLSEQIRRAFLAYFQKQHHTILPSSPVIPHDDPSLLFTNAGMNQFKDLFLGTRPRSYKRAATAQKCVRVGGKHNDLDNVGHTSRHLTFFEMLGNFSFGDYFKPDAIQWAWDLSLNVFQLEADRIWITVFQDDDEAFELWKKIVPEHRIVRMGEKDNFWSMGDTGPCGPCSELYFDRGPAYGDADTLLHDPSGKRFLEFWNLVFMQFDRNAQGVLTPLPAPSIDTGSGLERVVALRMDVDTVFATDILRSIIAKLEELSGHPYDPRDEARAAPFHVIADHLRSLSFAIADGAQPGNIERGYILRKLIRRAVRYGRLLGFDKPFLAYLVPRLIELMGSDYPELASGRNKIEELLTQEEGTFLQTLKRGGNLLASVVSTARHREVQEITGEEAFKLKDTYGLPLEEILLIAKDSHLTVNLESYQILEMQAKEKSKAASKLSTTAKGKESRIPQELEQTVPPTRFVGYEQRNSTAVVQAIVRGGVSLSCLQEGEEGLVVLDQTPFYAEKGGQVGDTGTLTTPHAELSVTDCQTLSSGIYLHHVTSLAGSLQVGDTVSATTHAERRTEIEYHHTATHLLHWALEQVLGSHIRQAGSLVDVHRLRFDFNHHKPVSREEIRSIEDLVNKKIQLNIPLKHYETPYADVQHRHEIKQFFGEKYGERVRVVAIPGVSQELCGGTHAPATGSLGYFRITKEGSVGTGVRRIEAVTGRDADLFVRQQVEELQAHITRHASELKQLEQQLKLCQQQHLEATALSLVAQATGTPPYLAAVVSVPSPALMPLAEATLKHLPEGIVVLAATEAGKCHIVMKLSPHLATEKLHAGHLLKELAPIMGGSGGGKSDAAQAGGKLPEQLNTLLAQLHQRIRGIL